MCHLEAGAVGHSAMPAVVLEVGVGLDRPAPASIAQGRPGEILNHQSVFTQGCDAQVTVSGVASPPGTLTSLNVSVSPSSDQRAMIL